MMLTSRPSASLIMVPFLLSQVRGFNAGPVRPAPRPALQAGRGSALDRFHSLLSCPRPVLGALCACAPRAPRSDYVRPDHSEFVPPLAVRLALHRALVLLLLTARCPPAVLRLVVPVRVATVKAVILGRARSHVCIEGGEITSPPVTNRDPAPSVVLVAVCARVVTTLLHARPRPIFGRVVHAVRLPVRVSDHAFTTSASSHRNDPMGSPRLMKAPGQKPKRVLPTSRTGSGSARHSAG
jgi:hypothetical protein